ncbi:hypothetical protein OIU77_023191 [Salix suchowensis]|uniref:Uncharacterized protein n=1 Tax=Salix suchowensis TaxID=1278906 RepID=A0ABQ9C2Y0_9ROSI|nr:hypothetical protein OIU77_023191 [Salix suchowensis]
MNIIFCAEVKTLSWSEYLRLKTLIDSTYVGQFIEREKIMSLYTSTSLYIFPMKPSSLFKYLNAHSIYCILNPVYDTWWFCLFVNFWISF